MKEGSDSEKKSDRDNPGIDFLQVLQLGGGIICAVIVVWLILHSILHVI
jgi:hypothetical protein